MNRKDLYNSFNEVDDDILERSEAVAKRKSSSNWRKWGALAACLCLVFAIVIPIMFHQPPEPPSEVVSPGDGPPSFIVNGVTFCVSPYPDVYETLPAGFDLTGEATIGGMNACPYYTNPDIPEWVYVYHEVTTDGTVDESGTLNRTDPHGAYVRYVDIRLRGKRLICYQGEYYIFMASAESYGSYPDVTHEYWNKMEHTYGIQCEGDLPDGFVSAGIAEFSGHDTIPRGDLASNTGDDEIFANPNVPDVVFASNLWHTDGKDWTFDVYIRYDFPLA